jgi:hypothetical protein
MHRCWSKGREQCSQKWRRWQSGETSSRVTPRPNLDGVVDEGSKAVRGEHEFHTVHCGGLSFSQNDALRKEGWESKIGGVGGRF